MQREWNRPLLWPAFLLGAIGIGVLLGFLRAVRRTKNQTA